MGVSVALTTVRLNVATAPSQYQDFPQLSALTIVPKQPGEVRTYANGRQRLILRAGFANTLTLTLPACNQAMIAWLNSNIGVIMCVRDDVGNKFFVTYFDVPQNRHRYDTEADIVLALNEVTFSEAV